VRGQRVGWVGRMRRVAGMLRMVMGAQAQADVPPMTVLISSETMFIHKLYFLKVP